MKIIKPPPFGENFKLKKYLTAKTWSKLLKREFQKPYMKKLENKLEQDYFNYNILPKKQEIFKALNLTDYNKVKVVLFGQDPYPVPGHAHGLVFGVPDDLQPKPPSLKIIFKEIKRNMSIKIPTNRSSLSGWAKQGVLLLNVILTVMAYSTGSHKNYGWEKFTDTIVKLLSKRNKPIIFVLWGAFAKQKKYSIKNRNHYILEAAHPASECYGGQNFTGCGHFSQINNILKSNKEEPINWRNIS